MHVSFTTVWVCVRLAVFFYLFILSLLLQCEFNINVSTQIFPLFTPYDAEASSACTALILIKMVAKLEGITAEEI